jgi:hypothetical protein
VLVFHGEQLRCMACSLPSFVRTETASLENGKTMDGVAREVENLAPCVVCTRIRALLIGCLI